MSGHGAGERARRCAQRRLPGVHLSGDTASGRLFAPISRRRQDPMILYVGVDAAGENGFRSAIACHAYGTGASDSVMGGEHDATGSNG